MLKRCVCLVLALVPACSRHVSDAVPPAAKSVPDAALSAPAPVAVHEGDDEDASGPGGGGKGQNRWRDTGVYVDGVPAGVLNFGELPIGLKPLWIDDKAPAPIEPGTQMPGYRMVKSRRYRFTEYLTAIGVPLKRVKELHVYGPRFSQTIVVTGAQLRSKAAEGFQFRFASNVAGKALPVTPYRFANLKAPDKISAVMVYLDKKPPVLVRNEGLALNGEIVAGVPYYGEPMRGGIRVYLDDRFAAQLKRKRMPPATRGADGTESWQLLDVLTDNQVDTKAVVEAWLINGERRTRKLTAAELSTIRFEMGARGNELLVGSEKSPARAIALHSRPLGDDELPKILPSEEL